jgi:type I restriction enzyme, S subunit
MSSAEFISKLLDVETEWKALESCASIERGQRVTKSELSPEKKYPVFSGGVTPMGFYDDFNQGKNTITIVKYGTAGFVNFIKTDFWANDVCYCIKPGAALSNRYLFHYLKKQQADIQSLATDAIPAHLPTEVISNYPVPVPCPANQTKSLEIQAEIARILDAFTELTGELAVELAARKKQYNHYRNKLMRFEGISVEWKTLGDIGEVRMCKRILKNETGLDGDVPFYKIGTFGKLADAFIPRDVYESYRSKYSFPKKGDVLISAAGTIGRAVIYDGEPAYFQDSNIVWLDNNESIVTNKYLYHFYKIAKWFVSEGGTIDRLYNDNIKKTKIPVPYPHDPQKSFAEQARIVAILDKFDVLTNSITEGLPREIELRQKQYEHYRDLLLNFPKQREVAA